MLGDLSGTQFGHMDVYLKFLEGSMLILSHFMECGGADGRKG